MILFDSDDESSTAYVIYHAAARKLSVEIANEIPNSCASDLMFDMLAYFIVKNGSEDLVIDALSIDSNYMVFINGRLDLRTMEFGPNDPSVFQTSYLNFEYDPNARYCPNFDAYIGSAYGSAHSV